jgi:hypothetical protein
MPFLKKTALIEDLSDAQFFQQYAFTREDNGEGIIELRPSEADKWKTFKDHLRNRNAHPSLLNNATIEAAAALDPQKRLAYAPARGWRPGGKTFVKPEGTVGANSKNICGIPPPAEDAAGHD